MPSPATSAITSAALKVAVPCLAIGGIVALGRWQKRDLRTTLALRPPAIGPTVAWVLAYAALVLGSDTLMHWRGPFDWAPWQAAPLVASALRVLAVAILGPIAEELVFRGALYERFTARGHDPRLVIVGLAAVWAVLHASYSSGVIALIVVGGIMLGAARRHTDSIVPPILMHIVWNAYAIL